MNNDPKIDIEKKTLKLSYSYLYQNPKLESIASWIPMERDAFNFGKSF
jgi:hypothetical protein